VRFLIDMPLSPALAQWLRAQGHDAVHAFELGMNRSPDDEIVARGVADSRTIITADLDYPRLLALTGATGPSLILFRGGDWADDEIIARMSDILAALAERDILQSILVIDRTRIRRRRLPIT
jgi:predicted nuclease of predicted toxin-antitoxin system